jgi:SecD/SecF fusion protein
LAIIHCIPTHLFTFSEETPVKQGKIGPILIIVLPLIAAAYLLWPTYRASNLEKERQRFVDARDSVGLASFDKTSGEALRKAREERIKLGLDLRGGMYVTLEIDVVRLLEEAASRDAADEILREVIEKTRQMAESTDEEVMDIFRRNFDAIARPKGKTLLSYYEIAERNADEAAVIKRLGENVNQAIDQAMEIVRRRIDKYGVSEPTIQKQGSRRIVVELPGVADEKEVRSLLQTTARLEFKLVRNNADIARAFTQIDQLLKNKGIMPVVAADTAKKDSSKAVASTAPKVDSTKKDSTKADTAKKSTNPMDKYAGLSQEEQAKRFREDYPFTALFVGFVAPPSGQPQQIIFNKEIFQNKEFPEADYIFQVPEVNVKQVEAILARADVKRILTNEYAVHIAAKPDRRSGTPDVPGQGIFEMYGTKGDAELTGDVITNALATFDQQSNQPEVIMDMSADGAERWARITGANIKKRVAVVLDDRVYTAPTVQNKITGGRSQITGSSNIEEAKLLEIILKAGALKAPLKVVEERVIGPSLGEDSIRKGVISTLAAAALVVLFMSLYYAAGGLIADIAVLINIILIIALLAAFKGTLTLPGIAGLILTLGMAVDVNILIYERIREELYRGRTLRAAVDEGFKRAFGAIIDSNILTVITGIILFKIGTGPIQGFAVTLIIGVLMTLFTAITVSRAIIELRLMGGLNEFNFGQDQKFIPSGK